MSSVSVGFTDDGERALVTITFGGTTLSFDTETAKWLAEDLETWAERIETINRVREENT